MRRSCGSAASLFATLFLVSDLAFAEEPPPAESLENAPPETAAPQPPEPPPPLPPPDTSKGERSDGKINPSDARRGALMVPRVILWLPRQAVYVLGLPFHGGLALEERYRLYQRAIDAVTWKEGRMGLRLAFEFALDFRPMTGVSFFYDHYGEGHSRPFVLATFMVGGRDLLQTTLNLRPMRNPNLEFDIGYNRHDDRVFHGISTLADLGEVRYGIQAFDFWTRYRWPFRRFLSLELGTSFGLRRYGEGHPGTDDPTISAIYCVRLPDGSCIPGTVDERLVPGFNEGTNFFRAMAAVKIDTRRHAAAPSNGVLFDAGSLYTKGLTDPSTYFNVFGSLAGYINLYRGTHVLVLRLATEMVAPTNSAAVPFSELAILGGADTMRGFRAGRFTDYSSLIGSAEYRWPIWMWIDGAIFADYGGTFGRFYDDFSFDLMKPDIGGALRLRTPDRVYLRLQVAYGFWDGVQAFFSVSTGI